MYIYIVWTLLFLLICTITDLKEQKIFMPLCLVSAVGVLLAHFLRQDASWMNLLGGMALGAVFFVVSIGTKEKLGLGDAAVIFTLGCITGFRVVLEILFWSFAACILFATIGLIFKKICWKSRIAFAPFLLSGAVITFVLQSG